MAERRLIIIGAGGVGGWLAEGLVRMLEFGHPGSALLIVDGDNFEPKNKERQNFREMGNKAEVLAKHLTSQFPKTFVLPVPQWVVPSVKDTESETHIAAKDLLEGGDVVYAVVDNHACRKLVIETAATLDDIDVFLGGNDDQLFGSVYHYQRREGRDVTDNPAEHKPELVAPGDRNPGELSCQERAELEGGTQFVATNFAVAAFLLGRTQHCIFNDNVPIQTEQYFDLGAGLAQSFDRRTEEVAELAQ